MIKPIILAIILVESSFNPKAYNKEGNATGLLQITPIGLLEASWQCNIPAAPDLFNPTINLMVGSCLYNFYRKKSNSKVEALILYHGGYNARDRFRRGRSPGPKTRRYVNLVLHYEEMIKNEEITIKSYCDKHPSLPDILCQSFRNGQKEDSENLWPD